MKRKTALLALMLLPATFLLAADEKPARPDDGDIKAMLAKLGDDNPDKRQEARTELMGLPGESLDDLHRIVTTASAPSLVQVSGLHDVIVHLYLKRQGYTAVGAGIKNAQPTYVLGIPGPSATTNDDETVRIGFPITTLVPGLPNYQFLKVGDLVTGIYIDPKQPLTRMPNQQTQNWAQFRSGIQSAAAVLPRSGPPVVEMEVIRGGTTIRLKVPMCPKPVEMDNDNPGVMQTFLTTRANNAERYWHTDFAVPLKIADD